MDTQIERYIFRLQLHGATGEFGGRILIKEDGHTLQLWLRTPQQANHLLEVGPVGEPPALWPLFRTLCDYKGILPLEFKRVETPEGSGPWRPIPGGL